MAKGGARRLTSYLGRYIGLAFCPFSVGKEGCYSPGRNGVRGGVGREEPAVDFGI